MIPAESKEAFGAWLEQELQTNEVTVIHFSGGGAVKLYGISSEDNTQLQADIQAWKLEHTTMFGNPSNTIADYLKEKYVPDLVISDDKRYPNGMVQPAELVFVGSKPIVLWTKQPKATNMFGAVGRPDAKKMWAFITKARENAETVECSDGEQFTNSISCTIM